LQRKHGDLAHLPSLVYHPHMLRHAAALLVVSADLRPSTLKYGNRSYRFASIEAGAAIQNVALAAAEQGIGWRALGGLESGSVAQCCGIGESDHVLIAGVLGMPRTGDATSDSITGRQAPIAIDFLWSDGVPGLPFHLAMARVKPDSPTASSEFSWGRDRNAWRAYDKAVAEATERYAYRQPRPLRSARWAPGAGMCDPRTLIAYTRAQYANEQFPFKPFDPGADYLWVEARHPMGGVPRWVPAEFVLHRTALPADYLERCMTFSSSSGCASGVSEAMAQESALFELIERDAFMRHWFAQRGGIGVAPETLPSSFADRIDALIANGCRLVVQVLDLGVQPVWMVAIQHHGKHFTAVGAAAGLDLDAVLHSAFSEAETAAYVRLAGMDCKPIHPAQVATPAQHADLYAQRKYYRRADALLAPTRMAAFHELAPPHQREMRTVYAALGASGLEPLWVDLSVPNAPLTLTGERLVSGRMIVPGLIPIAFGASSQPLGMSRTVHRRARFPHPFP
jgi:ribosomal protein S12 methylthiotransferase accessory factor